MDQQCIDAASSELRDRTIGLRQRDKFAGWLETFEWHAVGHLTCDIPLTSSRLKIAFCDEFHRRLTRVGQGAVSWFLVIEEGVLPGLHLHAHCLLHGPGALTIKKIEQCWHRGFTRISRFEPNRGATKYLASKTFRNPDCWSFSKTMPPLLALGRRAA